MSAKFLAVDNATVQQRLISLNQQKAELFASNTYNEADALWVQTVKATLEDLGLDAGNEALSQEYQTKLFEVLSAIDAVNKDKKESEKQRLDADVIRAIAYNKGTKEDTSFRFQYASYDCVRAPITNTGSFRVFTNQGLTQSRPMFNLMGGNKSRASDYLKGVQALQIIRSRGGTPDGYGWLGGLTDTRVPFQSLKEQLVDRLHEWVAEIAFEGDFSFEGDIEGKSAAEVLKDLRKRAAVELSSSIMPAVQLAILEIAKNGDDRVFVDILNGKIGKATLATDQGQTQTATKTSRREAIEELANALEYLHLSVTDPLLHRSNDELDLRRALYDQLATFIERLRHVDGSENQLAVYNSTLMGRFAHVGQGAARDPLGADLKQIPMRHVFDDAFFYTSWLPNPENGKAPNDMLSAMRPPAGVPKICLVKPIGFRNRLAEPVFQLFADAGRECKEIAAQVHTSVGAEYDGIKQALKENELKGLQAIDILSALKQYGKKGGTFKDAMTGNDLEYCYRYAHEYFGLIDEARARFEQVGPKDMTATEMLVLLVEELQQDIVDQTVYEDTLSSEINPATGQAYKLNEGVYNIDIINMVRMMNGGKLTGQADLAKHAMAAGLDANTFERMQLAVERVMKQNGYLPTSTLKGAMSSAPRTSEPNLLPLR